MPAIEIIWGAEWKRNQRRYARPYIECAAELAMDGLSLLGIQITSDRELRARRVGRTAEIDGEQLGKVAELSVCCQDIKRRRLTRVAGRLCKIAVHELAHTEHEARMGAKLANLIGDAVSEGIAYTAETDFSRLLFASNNGHDLIGAALDGPSLNHLLPRLVTDSDNCTADSIDSERLRSRWFEDYNNEWDTPIGVVMGIRSVFVAQKQGMTYDDLLCADPRSVLQLCP